MNVVTLKSVYQAVADANSNYAGCGNRTEFSKMFGAYRRATDMINVISNSDCSSVKRVQSLKDFHDDRKYRY